MKRLFLILILLVFMCGCQSMNKENIQQNDKNKTSIEQSNSSSDSKSNNTKTKDAAQKLPENSTNLPSKSLNKTKLIIGEDNKLLSVDLDGTNRQIISDNYYGPGSLVENNNIIYYADCNNHNIIYGFDLKKNSKVKIADDYGFNLQVVDGRLYYTRNPDKFLVCYDIASKKSKVIVNSTVIGYKVYKNAIYFVDNREDVPSNIYKVNLDGSNREDVYKEPFTSLREVNNDKLYITTAESLYFYDLNTKSLKVMLKGINYFGFWFSKDYIFYVKDPDYKLYRMDLNGNNTKQMGTEKYDNLNQLIVSGEWVYTLLQNEQGDCTLKRISLDGTKEEKLTNIDQSKLSDLYLVIG